MSAKRRKKRPFEMDEPATSSGPKAAFVPHVGPVFDFFNSRSVRETVESVVVAVVLAMLFRTFGAEAYIIPTGSMAPTLQGQHMDVQCDHCGYRYLTGSSEDNSTIPEAQRKKVTTTFCPFCRSSLIMKPAVDADHKSNNGDRIIVNKFIYDFKHPERFDVIVFKNPNNGKQNFIKRLVGLPNENLTIENGDLFQLSEQNGEWTRQIVRKPARKLKAMLQIVDDTQYLAPELVSAGWPLKWQEWRNREDPAWTTMIEEGQPQYSIAASVGEKRWLRYRHLTPSLDVWRELESSEKLRPLSAEELQGELIGDYYCYNQRVVRTEARLNPGLHWVGDLGLEATLEVQSDAGSVFFDLVEGGVHFELEVDVATGVATLRNSGGYPFLDDDGQPLTESPTAATPIRSGSKFDILFVNADDQLRLWINGSLIAFSGSCYQSDRYVNPKWSPEDPGDAEPAGVATRNAAVEITRLRVWRDIYYSSVIGGQQNPQNETGQKESLIREVMTDPSSWESPNGLKVFNARFREGAPMFVLEENQFLPMGDNSPESSDGRIWDGPNFVSGDLMIGRALFIYWPHAKNKPIPFIPNFERMGPIR